METELKDAKTIMNTHKNPKGAPKMRKRADVPSTDDPREELRRLVMQHKALTKAAVSVEHMSSDRKNLKDGGVIECRLPKDVQEQFHILATDVARKAASRLEGAMVRQLKQIPIYQHFLSKVFGVGPVVAAYLVAEVDIHRAVKPSALRRFCGLAVINGRLERRTKGVKSGYSAEMRTRLYQAFSAMWKNGVGKGSTCKYLQIWSDTKHRKMQMAVEGKIHNGVKEVSAPGYAHSYGWHKAADILIEDLYVVWRALEGLPVWPSYYAAKLGYAHGGKICVNEPRMLNLEEALELVGDVEGTPHVWTEFEKKGVAVVEDIAEAAE